MSDIDSPTAHPGRRWLVGLLVALVATGVGLTGVAWHGHAAAVTWLDSPQCGFTVSGWKGWPCSLEARISGLPAEEKMTWSRWILGAYPVRVAWDAAKKLPETEGARLKQLRGMRSLDLSGAPGLTAAFFADIGTYQQMTTMRAAYTDYDDACTAHLPLLPRLERLDLHYTQVTGELFPSLPALTHVDASDSLFIDAGCQRLLTCRKLRGVYLQGTEVTLEGIRTVLSLPELEELGLPDHLDRGEVEALVKKLGLKVAVR